MQKQTQVGTPNGFVLEGRVIIEHESWKVSLAQIIYEEPGRKSILLQPKNITNRDDNGDFTITYEAEELITFPKKKIEIYLQKCAKASEVP